MEFDPRALAVVNRLWEHGQEAYLVGGCVRDGLRGVAAHDYDVTTSALPEETAAVFSHCPVRNTGLKHGTVTVLWEGLPVEVTTYRVDGPYADGRHPDGVTFTGSLTEDLARRDFTVNAMAWAPNRGLQDPFGGRDDLACGRLRCVGDPLRRFQEDALRILRALRFASALGFSIEDATAQGARGLKDRLTLVSAERIRDEFVKLLCGRAVGSVLSQYPDILGVFLPELLPAVGFDQQNVHHIYDVYTHTLHAVAAVPPRPHLRLAALLHDVGKPSTFRIDGKGVGHFYGHAPRSVAMAEEILTRLRFDNETRKAVVTLVRYHDTPIDATEQAVTRRLNRLGVERFWDLVALMRADNLAQAPEFHTRQGHLDEVEAIARRILAEEKCFSLRDLAVKGTDLMALGYEGKAIGEALNSLLNAVMDGRCPNEREALLTWLSSGDG